MKPSNTGFTEDAIFNGEVVLRQGADGYRFSLDALLLAWFAYALPAERALELGAGCGVVSLALARRRPGLSIDAVEIQAPLARLARGNAERNGLDSVTVHQLDLRHLCGPRWEGAYDLVFSNPPYRALGRGRLNRDPEKARARHELLCTLEEVAARAAFALRPGGRAAFVLLAARAGELEAAAARHGLGLRRRCWVRPRTGRAPNLLLALLQGGAGRAARALPDSELVVYEAPRRYTPTLKSILGGAWEAEEHPLANLDA